jgi:hypothetical protein
MATVPPSASAPYEKLYRPPSPVNPNLYSPIPDFSRGPPIVEASAPPVDLQYYQDIFKSIEQEKDKLNLDTIKSQLEYISQEVSKLKQHECNEQCQSANRNMDMNTLNKFLKEDMNKIFK